MKIIIIGDIGRQFLAKMLRKKGCSVISLQAIDWNIILNRVNEDDIIIAVPNWPCENHIEDCERLLFIHENTCIINTPEALSEKIPPSQTIRLKKAGNKSLIFHLWIKSGLTHISVPIKRHPVNQDESTIPEIIAKAMYKSWDPFFIVPIHYELPFIIK
jgi:hypothetical protein